eukprot:1151191-Pelagomonas_calceolata.AAC.2
MDEECTHQRLRSMHSQGRVDDQYALCNFGEAPFMGREPLGLPPSDEVHTWLPWPAQGTPCPEIWHALRANYTRKPCSVRGAGEAVVGAIETLLKQVWHLFGLGQPASHPP